MKILKLVIISLLVIITYFKPVRANIVEIQYFDRFYGDNNVFALLDLKNKDYIPLTLEENGSLLLTRNRGVSINPSNLPFKVSYISIDETKVKTDKETIEFIVNERENREHSREDYKLDFQSLEQTLEGALVEVDLNRTADSDLKVKLKGKLLKGKELRKRDYRGNIKEYEENHIGYKARLDRKEAHSSYGDKTNMHDVNFNSLGYSIGLILGWDISDNFKLKVDLDNLYSKIRWDDVYTLDGTLNTESIEVDEDGNIKHSSSFNGKFEYKTHYTNLTPNYNLAMLIRRRVGVGAEYKGDIINPYLSILLLERPLSLSGGVYSNLYWVGLEYKGVDLEFFTEDINLKSSPSLGINLSLALKY